MSSAISKALARSQALYSVAHHTGLSLKKPSIGEILSPYDGFANLGMFQEQSAAARKYALYRGWVYSAINAIAVEAAGQPLMLGQVSSKHLKGRPTGIKSFGAKLPKFIQTKAAEEEIDVVYEHALLDALSNPNPIQGLWQYTYSFVANLCLTGWSFIVIDDKGEDGRDYYSIPTNWIRPDHTKGAFAEFRIVNPTNPTAGDLSGPTFSRSQVRFAHLPNPGDLMSALSPATAQSLAISVDDQIQTSQESFFSNGIFPSVIITMGTQPHPEVPAGVRPRLTQAQRRQVYGAIRKVSGGIANYGNPAIIDGMIEKIERLSASQVEMGWEKSEQTVRTRILSAFGVHPFILGEQMPGSYAQAYIVQDRFFKRVNTMLSMLGNLHTDHAREYDDPGLLVWWEPCKALDPGMERSLWETARKNGDITQNEFRHFMGLPPDDDGQDETIDKSISKDVIAVAQAVRGGQLAPEQATAILTGMGIPEKQAVEIAGEPAPQPVAPVPGAPGQPGVPGQPPVPGQGPTPDQQPPQDQTEAQPEVVSVAEAMKSLDRLLAVRDLAPATAVSRIVRKTVRPNDELKTLYVARPVLNGEQILEWARSQGLQPTIAPEELHVTIVYSEAAVDWSKLSAQTNEIRLTGGRRQMALFGPEEDVVVLRISSNVLSDRHEEFLDAGAVSTFPTYRPHITLSYGADVDISTIKPYRGPIDLGPEAFEEIAAEVAT